MSRDDDDEISSRSQWDVSDRARQQLTDQMRQAMYGAPGDTAGRRERAMQMAGTRDTRSRAYKSARDRLGRWSKGQRKPNKASLRRLTDQRTKGGRGIKVSITATFTTSKTKWTGKPTAYLSGDALDDFQGAIAQGDSVLAVQILANEYGNSFGDAVSAMEDPQGFEFGEDD